MFNSRVKPENKNTVLYYNKGYTRKKQIYDWTEEILRGENLYYSIKTYEDFVSAIEKIIYDNIDNLGYILENNIAYFGKETILYDLMIGIFRKKLDMEKKEDNVQYEIKKVKKFSVKTKELKNKYSYGYSNGKKVRASFTIEISSKGREYKKFRSLKTGRFVAGRKK